MATMATMANCEITRLKFFIKYKSMASMDGFSGINYRNPGP
jgi:hypothetical protein